MENVYIDLGDEMTIGSGDAMVIGEDNLLTESETMTGPQGPPGPQGPAGFSPVATVTQNEGSATITITDATHTSSATVYDGTDGIDGSAATITVGSTTTGEPGTQASVTNSGSSSAAVLNFVIPKGVKGDQGEQGDAATVDVGTIIAIAPDDTPQVTNSGTVHDAILNFAIPQGYDGFSPVATVTQNTGSATISITDENGTTTATVYDGQDGAPGHDGAPGQDGQAATITVGSTTTGNAGTNASVTNSGTSSAAVLDFVIPRGADGQNGTNGTDGSDGFSPIATVTQNTGSATISITDANGTTTATVYDGAPGTVPNDGTLTIQKNGTTVQTFTANQSSNATANITVPTQFSDLSGSVTSSQIDWATIYNTGLDTGWIEADQYINTTYFAARSHIYYRVLSGIVYWSGAIYCHTAPNSQIADLLTGLPSELTSIDEATFYGLQFMVQNSDYQIWVESGKLRVYEANQNIPVTQSYQGYTLTQVKYISASV